MKYFLFYCLDSEIFFSLIFAPKSQVLTKLFNIYYINVVTLSLIGWLVASNEKKNDLYGVMHITAALTLR